MTARRTRGEGTVLYNEERQRWEGRYTVEYDPETGNRKRQKFTGRTRAEVVAKMAAARTAMNEGRTPTVDRRTVAQYMNQWADNVLPGTVASTTLVQYRNVIKLYIVPTIGTKRVATLTPGDVSEMMRKLTNGYGNGAKKQTPKAPNTVRLARSILRRALRRAEQEGTISRNVAAIADGVKVPAPEGRTLTVEQAKQLLVAASRDRLHAAYLVALMLGLRRGELLGLRWEDLHLDDTNPTLTIVLSLKRIPGVGYELSEPKTAGSRRTVHLPAQVVAALKDHRRRQLEERLAIGPSWPAAPLGADLVFRSPLGTPLDPDNFRKATYKLTETAFKPDDVKDPRPGDRWSPHELRHSAASLLIAQGVDLKVISELLGHSSIRITADVYGHLLSDAGLVAADAMSAALFS